MKNFKKVIALMLSLVMVLGCIPTSYASEPRNLTIVFGDSSYDLGDTIPTGFDETCITGVDLSDNPYGVDSNYLKKIVEGEAVSAQSDTVFEEGIYYYLHEITIPKDCFDTITYNGRSVVQNTTSVDDMKTVANINGSYAAYYLDTAEVEYDTLTIIYGYEIVDVKYFAYMDKSSNISSNAINLKVYSQGIGTPTAYQWQKAEAETPTQFSNVDSATSQTLALTSLGDDDDGDAYECIITVGSETYTTEPITIAKRGKSIVKIHITQFAIGM